MSNDEIAALVAFGFVLAVFGLLGLCAWQSDRRGGTDPDGVRPPNYPQMKFDHPEDP
jgi:hypothetical protein